MIEKLHAQTNVFCPLCRSFRFASVYIPIGSAINAHLHVCLRCAFVGTIGGKTQKVRGPASDSPRLSCDADYSDVRVGKLQMLESSWNLICKTVDVKRCEKVLDVSSAKGSFALRIHETLEHAEITCIEPDEYMSTEYESKPRIQVLRSLDDLRAEANNFDLIYSCHSLEHYRDPIKHLRFLRSQVASDGFIYLEVPNLRQVNHGPIVEEYFYDHHKSFFVEEVLLSAARSVGLNVYASDSNDAVIRLVLSVGSESLSGVLENEELSDQIQANIREYSQRIFQDRNSLPTIVKSWKLGEGGKTFAVFGCGRMLDALERYGNMKLRSDTALFDSVLAENPRLNQRGRIRPISEISQLSPDQVVIAAKSSVNQMRRIVQALCPKIEILCVD